MTSSTLIPPLLSRLLPALALALVLFAIPQAEAKQATYASPEAAVDALVAAAKSGKLDEMLTVLGRDGREVASSGDSVADGAARERFVSAYDETHELKKEGSGATLIVGKDEFPFPIPLVEANGAWRFDTAAGREEILDRRIGANELAAIEVVRAYVDAQREYADADRDGKGPQYARRLASSEGKTDGLYWPTEEGQAESPLGPLVADARAEGYRKRQGGPTPYHGYLFRVLTAQGKDAAGGARSYVVGGRMIGGFGLVAAPAEYGNSGVMTFIVDQKGEVLQKDLGPDTSEIAADMTTFDPDADWKPVGRD